MNSLEAEETDDKTSTGQQPSSITLLVSQLNALLTILDIPIHLSSPSHITLTLLVSLLEATLQQRIPQLSLSLQSGDREETLHLLRGILKSVGDDEGVTDQVEDQAHGELESVREEESIARKLVILAANLLPSPSPTPSSPTPTARTPRPFSPPPRRPLSSLSLPHPPSTPTRSTLRIMRVTTPLLLRPPPPKSPSKVTLGQLATVLGERERPRLSGFRVKKSSAGSVEERGTGDGESCCECVHMDDDDGNSDVGDGYCDCHHHQQSSSHSLSMGGPVTLPPSSPPPLTNPVAPRRQSCSSHTRPSTQHDSQPHSHSHSLSHSHSSQPHPKVRARPRLKEPANSGFISLVSDSDEVAMFELNRRRRREEEERLTRAKAKGKVVAKDREIGEEEERGVIPDFVFSQGKEGWEWTRLIPQSSPPSASTTTTTARTTMTKDGRDDSGEDARTRTREADLIARKQELLEQLEMLRIEKGISGTDLLGGGRVRVERVVL
ncbi:hypothetical protein T439DRAFT_322127 [Meredithblackwellia eburnea MCA 4105]